MPNPFNIGVIPDTAPLCDRETELDTLKRRVLDATDVTLYSPRRYGKTSLVKRVQAQLRAEHGVLTVYADLYRVTTVEEVAARISKAVYAALHRQEDLLDKAKRYIGALVNFRPVLKPNEQGEIAVTVDRVGTHPDGVELLSTTMEYLGKFVEKYEKPVHIALDEFQEITEIQRQNEIEAALRTQIQHISGASFFFIGSRRRILLEMFSSNSRPFFQSTSLFKLERLPKEDLVDYIGSRFAENGKTCDPEVAAELCDTTECYPSYAQKTANYLFDMVEAGGAATIDNVQTAFAAVLKEESDFFKAILFGLTLKEVQLLRAIARDNSHGVFSADFAKQHEIQAFSAQKPLKKLTNLDLVEPIEDQKGRYQLVDPVMAVWLKEH
jgi:AAA+ ATPase superfamily predicted ATPase